MEIRILFKFGIPVLTVLSILINTVYTTNHFPIPSDSDLETLSRELRHAYGWISPAEGGPTFASIIALPFKPLAGSVLRLMFHDCGGPPEGHKSENGFITKCDGCFEMDDFADHQNLEMRASDPLDDIYLGSTNNWYQKMSRADFWAFAANEAIRYTRSYALDNAILPEIPNYFGREDCSTSPDLDNTITDHNVFPSALFGWSNTKTWLNTAFDLTDEEIVAIMGAHTIGRTHRDDSGFSGPWVPSWGIFNNAYYKELISGKLRQTDASGNGLKVWTGSAFIEFFSTFLNADVGLYVDIDNYTETGAVSCGDDINTCPLNMEASTFVLTFASDTQAWLDAFVPAYIKMITAGYDINTELIDAGNNYTRQGVGLVSLSIIIGAIDDVIVDIQDVLNGGLQDAITQIDEYVGQLSEEYDALKDDIANYQTQIDDIKTQLDEDVLPLIAKIRQEIANILGNDDDEGEGFTSTEASYELSSGYKGSEIIIQFTISQLYILGFVFIIMNILLSMLIGKYCCNSSKYRYKAVSYDSNTDE